MGDIEHSIVHEAQDERQNIRIKITGFFSCENKESKILDISLGGVKLEDFSSTEGLIKSGALNFVVDGITVTIPVKLRVISSKDSVTRAEFIDLDIRSQKSIRCIVSSFVAGDMASLDEIITTLQKETHVKKRKPKELQAKTVKERVLSILGTLVFLVIGLGLASVLLTKIYFFLFSAKSIFGDVQIDKYSLRMPENGLVKFLVDGKQEKVEAGQPLATMSSHLMSKLTTPEDFSALSNMTDEDMSVILGKALIETTISSPCDCYIYKERRMRDRYAYKDDVLLTLLDKESKPWVSADFEFSALEKINLGGHVEVKIAGSSEVYDGKIRKISVDKILKVIKAEVDLSEDISRNDFGKPVSVRTIKQFNLL